LGGLEIFWVGHASFRLVTPGGKVVYIDPWINGNPVSPIKMDDVKEANLVLVTHGHEDHVGDSLDIVRRTGAVLVAIPEIGFYAEKKGFPYGGANNYPLHIGGSATVQGLRVSMVFAAHSSEIYGEEWLKEKAVTLGSGCCGFVLEAENGVRVYHSGDTGLFGDMALIRELHRPTIALLPIGGRYTMDVRQASIAARLLKPRVLIPMHYNTYPDQAANTEDLKRLVRKESPRTRVVVMKPGETYTYTGRP